MERVAYYDPKDPQTLFIPERERIQNHGDRLERLFDLLLRAHDRLGRALPRGLGVWNWMGDDGGN